VPRLRKPGDRATTTAAVLLAALAGYVRLRAAPGAWDDASLDLFDSIRGGGPSPAVAWACVPGALASAAVVLVLWRALRGLLGDTTVLLPGALWAFLGVDLQSAGQFRPDAFFALASALALWGLLAAQRRTAAIVVIATVGSAVVAALALVAADRPEARAAVPSSAAALGVGQLLLTDSAAFGLLFVAALPLLARLPFRALRGDPVAAPALAALVSVAALSVVLGRAPQARDLAAPAPILLAALVDALCDRGVSRVERWTSLLAAAVGLRFALDSNWARVVVPPALALCAWPALPDAVAKILGERTQLGLASAALIVATVAWPSHSFEPTTLDWIVAAAAGALVVSPWLVGKDGDKPWPRFALGAALVLAVATTRSRFVADPAWDVWARLPSSGRVFAERIVGRRLLVASGADASRVVLLAERSPAPKGLALDDRVVALDEGPLLGGLRLADACRLPDSGLRPEGAPLGEVVIFGPSR
jgi:hypothetical protein